MAKHTLTKIIAVDTETTGLFGFGTPEEGSGIWPARPHFVSITNYDGETWSYTFKVDPFTREVLYSLNQEAYNEIKSIMEDPLITKVFHNALFDTAMFFFAGIKTLGRIFDTKVMAHVADSSRMTFALKPLAKDILGIADDDLTQLKASLADARRKAKKLGWAIAEESEADYHLAPPALLKTYGERDTERTMGLYWFYEEKYDTDEVYRGLVDMEMKVIHYVSKMQMRGARLSEEALADLSEYYGQIIVEKDKELTAALKERGISEPLNTRSTTQMKKFFYDTLGLPPRKNKKTGALSCDSKALVAWANQGVKEARIICDKNAADHELGTFVVPFEGLIRKENGVMVLHPSYNTCGPITGRMSCSKPNLQNIPAYSAPGKGKSGADVAYRIREVFVPRPGYIWYLPDYSQVEVWTAVFMAQDKFGMESLLGGADMHAVMARKIWGSRADFEENFSRYRKSAKMILFGMIYGSGVSGIMESAKCDYQTAMEIRESFHETFYGIFGYMDKLSAEIERCGRVVSPFGRVYNVDKDFGYKALNYMIQGSCADIMKRAIISVWENVAMSNRWAGISVLLTIHDELIIEVPKRLHCKALMKDIVHAMQMNFHEFTGVPNPYPVGMKIAEESWAFTKEIEL